MCSDTTTTGFEEALAVARFLGLTSVFEWRIRLGPRRLRHLFLNSGAWSARPWQLWSQPHGLAQPELGLNSMQVFPTTSRLQCDPTVSPSMLRFRIMFIAVVLKLAFRCQAPMVRHFGALCQHLLACPCSVPHTFSPSFAPHHSAAGLSRAARPAIAHLLSRGHSPRPGCRLQHRLHTSPRPGCGSLACSPALDRKTHRQLPRDHQALAATAPPTQPLFF